MRRALKAVWHLLAIVGVVIVAAVIWLALQGISARDEPGQIETTVARAVRSVAIPSAFKTRLSPELSTSDTIRAGLEHWADHCASCHANDGSGQTEMGQGLYPRPPDMRTSATQNLSDGELFYIIEHGVKLTGMPAWGTGTPDGERASWHLVHFIRHLPKLSEEELAEMEMLNPKTPADWQALEEERRFLAGEGPAPKPAPRHEHKGGQE